MLLAKMNLNVVEHVNQENKHFFSEQTEELQFLIIIAIWAPKYLKYNFLTVH